MPLSSSPVPHETVESTADSYEDFCERLYPKLFATARRSIRHVEDAEDVVQEVLLALWNNWGKIRKHEAWLFGTLRKRILLYFRTKKRSRLQYMDSLEVPMALQGTENASHGLHRDINMRVDLRRILPEALEELREEQRDILIARDVLGMTGREVAERSVCRYQASSIGTLLSRARSAVERRLAAGGITSIEAALNY